MLIFPTALKGETILPDIPTPSFPKGKKANSPLLTNGGGENVTVAEPHVALVNVLL